MYAERGREIKKTIKAGGTKYIIYREERPEVWSDTSRGVKTESKHQAAKRCGAHLS